MAMEEVVLLNPRRKRGRRRRSSSRTGRRRRRYRRNPAVNAWYGASRRHAAAARRGWRGGRRYRRNPAVEFPTMGGKTQFAVFGKYLPYLEYGLGGAVGLMASYALPVIIPQLTLAGAGVLGAFYSALPSLIVSGVSSAVAYKTRSKMAAAAAITSFSYAIYLFIQRAVPQIGLPKLEGLGDAGLDYGSVATPSVGSTSATSQIVEEPQTFDSY